MNIKKIGFYLMASFLFVVLLSDRSIVNAQEGDIGGGAVQTNGEIGFFDETIISSTTDTSTPKTTEEPKIVKPAGKFPSTGELVQKSLMISGGLIIAGLIVAMFVKRGTRKGREAKK